jgi:hypothetical protein
MTIKDSKGRTVDVEVSGASDDPQVERATYRDDGSDVPESECEWISTHQDLSEEYLERQLARADHYIDEMKERGE